VDGCERWGIRGARPTAISSSVPTRGNQQSRSASLCRHAERWAHSSEATSSRTGHLGRPHRHRTRFHREWPRSGTPLTGGAAASPQVWRGRPEWWRSPVHVRDPVIRTRQVVAVSLGYEANGHRPALLIGSCGVPPSQGRSSMVSTSSSRPDRCPQRPYYHFYYGRPRILTDNSARPPSSGVPGGRVREALNLVGVLADLGDLSQCPRRPRDRPRNLARESGNTSRWFSWILTPARRWRASRGPESSSSTLHRRPDHTTGGAGPRVKDCVATRQR
jgi:hypothetical protein